MASKYTVERYGSLGAAIIAERNDLRAALQSIKDMTDVDNPDSYRADDREGCLDTVFAAASEALAAGDTGEKHG